MTPVEGINVIYKDHVGVIRFVDEYYATICVRQFQQRNRDVCIVVYRSDFKNIRLLKESQK
jgi:hypothetical protein